MKPSLIKELILYQYRYIVGYILYSALLIALLTVNVTSIPNGLTSAEMLSATQSATTSLGSLLFTSAIDAPYMLLQKLSLHFLGLTTLAIKLPSIILAILTGIALALMLRRWFRVNVAVLSGILIATSAPFLIMGRTGTAAIMMTFWLSIILLAATKMLHNKRHIFFWKLTCFVAAALSLYTPLMIYPLIALGIAGLLHPHVRFILRKVSKKKFAAAILLSLVMISPLIWSIYQSPSTLTKLLGLPEQIPSLQQLAANSRELATTFYAFGNIQAGELMLPLFGAASSVLIALGLLKTLSDSFAARSYMILIWLFLVTPVAAFNPDAVLVYFMPIVLLLSIGIETLIREWYKLFPRNPYARVAALIPLTILLVSISASNIGRYFYGYQYIPQTQVFHQELEATRATLSKQALTQKPVALVVPENELAFYDLLRRDYRDLTVSSAPSSSSVIVTEKKYQTLTAAEQQSLQTPYRLVTSGLAKDALLLRVYVPR